MLGPAVIRLCIKEVVSDSDVVYAKTLETFQ